MAISPPEGGDEQDSTDFLSTQVVFGSGSRPAVGLDVLATKVAVDFQGLSSEGGDSCVKRNLEALREAPGVDAICIALFDADRKIIERVASATAGARSPAAAHRPGEGSPPAPGPGAAGEARRPAADGADPAGAGAAG